MHGQEDHLIDEAAGLRGVRIELRERRLTAATGQVGCGGVDAQGEQVPSQAVGRGRFLQPQRETPEGAIVLVNRDSQEPRYILLRSICRSWIDSSSRRRLSSDGD